MKTTLIALIALVALLTVSTVNAATLAGIAGDEVIVVRTSSGHPTTPTSIIPGGYIFTRDLTLGSTGSDVVTLQNFLEYKGTLVVPAGVSKGYFGSLTQSGLGSYQSMVGIAPAAGYFGPITRAHVNSLTAPVPEPSSSLLMGLGVIASLIKRKR